MAEEFIRAEQFGEFVKRMDDRFEGVGRRFDDMNQSINQRFDDMNQGINLRFDDMKQRLADAEKAREQDLLHINQRFDYVDQRFSDLQSGISDLQSGISDIRADMRQMRNWLVWLFGLVVFGFIGSIVLMLLRDALK